MNIQGVRRTIKRGVRYGRAGLIDPSADFWDEAGYDRHAWGFPPPNGPTPEHTSGS
jgi:hypothetical protein